MRKPFACFIHHRKIAGNWTNLPHTHRRFLTTTKVKRVSFLNDAGCALLVSRHHCYPCCYKCLQAIGQQRGQLCTAAPGDSRCVNQISVLTPHGFRGEQVWDELAAAAAHWCHGSATLPLVQSKLQLMAIS